MVAQTRKLRALVVVLLPGVLLASGVASAEDRGLSTGGAHHVVVTSYPTMGLEVGMPRQGWYAKGIQLDIKGKYQQAYDAYLKADNEFRALQLRRPRWKKQIRGWLVKARFQRDQSRMLRTPTYGRYRYRSSYARYRNAGSLHHKWLGIRAFTGRRNPAMQKKIIEEYKYLLVRSARDYRPRLMLAGMYNEMGLRSQARHQFDQVPTSYRSRYDMEMAYYYTTAGDRKNAFAFIKKATRYYSYRRLVLQSNLFDRLRTDPRFKKLVGEP